MRAFVTAAGMLAIAAVVALAGPVATAPPPGFRWIEIAERGGEKLRAAVVSPEGTGPVAVLIVLHGTEGLNEDYDHLAEAYAGAGFLAIAGCWFAGNECPHGPPFQGVTLDTTRHVRALITAAAALPRARSDRVALFGHSRGAMLALLAASSGTEVRAVVASSGQFAPAYTATRRRTPIDVAPITMASTLHAPVLILHATGDEQAHVHWAREYESALREHGHPVEAHYYGEATHGLPFVATTRDDVLRQRAAGLDPLLLARDAVDGLSGGGWLRHQADSPLSVASAQGPDARDEAVPGRPGFRGAGGVRAPALPSWVTCTGWFHVGDETGVRM